MFDISLRDVERDHFSIGTTASTENKPRLLYFGLAGRAELARLLFAFGGLEFDEMQITYPEFVAAKTTLDLPFGQLPTLQIGHKTYGQSLAIARYVAKLVGLYPSEPLLALQVDAFADGIVEIYNTVFSIFFGSYDETTKDALLTDTISNIIPWSLENLEQLVQGPFLLGDEISYADVYVLDLFVNLLGGFQGKLFVETGKYSQLNSIVDRLKQCKQLKSYLQRSHAQ
ncbi:hypothetical protein AC1031_018026 [Aphanomyces cochlioides]|nr:hypothetical protein AC1031_018026 [Aphanomyces cochlioides]